MARTLDQVLAGLPAKRRAKIERRASELATLKDLRQAVERTQQDMAESLGVGQDTISRIERRSDMLLSTLRRYVEAMGGKLELVAQFPDRKPLVIDHLATGLKREAPAPGVKKRLKLTSLARGKYAERVSQATKIILREPPVSKAKK